MGKDRKELWIRSFRVRKRLGLWLGAGKPGVEAEDRKYQFSSLRFRPVKGRFHPLTMDDVSKQTMDLIGWAHTNRKPLIRILVTVAIVAAVVGGWIGYKNHREVAGSEALSNIRPQLDARGRPLPVPVEAYLKVADDYAGTTGGARALLIAGGMLFEAGKFTEAQAQFDRFLREYPEYPVANEALLGAASSLEAQGKTNDAIARYEDLINHHTADTTAPQAKAALAQLYVAENKPEPALRLYEELMRSANNDSWSVEASIQREELLDKYPNLKKPAPTSPALLPVAPTLPAATSSPPATSSVAPPVKK